MAKSRGTSICLSALNGGIAIWVALASACFSDEASDATYAPQASFKIAPAAVMNSINLGAGGRINVYCRGLSTSQKPRAAVFWITTTEGTSQWVNTIANDRYDVIYVSPKGRIVPAIGGLYQVKECTDHAVTCERITDEAILRRANISPKSYFVIAYGRTTVYRHSLSLHNISVDSASKEVVATLLIDATSMETTGESPIREESKLVVKQGDLVTWPASSKFGGQTFVHRVRRIVPSEEDPNGLQGWVEFDSAPEPNK